MNGRETNWATRDRPSALRIVDEFLQASRKVRCEPAGPCFVDELNVEHISQVHSVFVAEDIQFHAHEGFQRQCVVTVDLHRFVDIGCGQNVCFSHFFAG